MDTWSSVRVCSPFFFIAHFAFAVDTDTASPTMYTKPDTRKHRGSIRTLSALACPERLPQPPPPEPRVPLASDTVCVNTCTRASAGGAAADARGREPKRLLSVGAPPLRGSRARYLAPRATVRHTALSHAP